MNILDIPGNVLVYFLYIAVFGVMLLVILSIKSVNFFREIYLAYLEIIQDIRTKKAQKDITKGKPPVLYLRPFLLDGIKYSQKEVDLQQITIKGIRFEKQYIQSHQLNFELELLGSAQKLGPFISIGSPKTRYDNFGAARFFYEDDVWKDNALKYMEEAIMILVRISVIITNGFAWEIEQIKKSFLPKTVFFLDIRDTANYNSFLKRIDLFNLQFPADFYEMKEGGCYICFDENDNRFSSFVLETNRVYLSCKKKLKNIK